MTGESDGSAFVMQRGSPSSRSPRATSSIASRLATSPPASHPGWRLGRREAAPAAGPSRHPKSPKHQEGRGATKLYGFEWIPGAGAVGAVLLLLIVPSFALIGLVVIALAAVAALVALAGAVLAMPYLLVRTVRRRLAERHQPTEVSVPIATAIALGRGARRELRLHG
jgi:hypothetical protein